MKKSKRYNTSHFIEDQPEPGSHGMVLKNKLAIKRVREMNHREKEAQMQAMEKLTDIFDEKHQFTTADICKIHKVWLINIYAWAGKYRQVKMSKGDFSFAFPEQIPKLMADLDKGPLREFTPCRFKSMEEVIKALAIVHTELVLTIPFEKEMDESQECWLL